MGNRAFNLETEEETSAMEFSPSPNFRVVPDLVPAPRLVSVALEQVHSRRNKRERRRRRLLNFIALEAIAILLFVAVLLAGTSKQFAQEGLTSAFLVAIFVMAAAVTLIPVLFFGLPVQKYRYRSRRRSR